MWPGSAGLVVPYISLSGPRQFQQLLVTGHYADGTVRDLTRVVKYSSLQPQVAKVSEVGVVTTAGDGTAEIVIAAGSLQSNESVAVANFAKPDPINFKTDVIPALTRMRCNSGSGCHGTPTGKNGFRLSLQGYLPD